MPVAPLPGQVSAGLLVRNLLLKKGQQVSRLPFEIETGQALGLPTPVVKRVKVVIMIGLILYRRDPRQTRVVGQALTN